MNAEVKPRTETFAQMVKRLFKLMDTEAASNIHAAVGMTGETGELLIAILTNDLKNLVEELGDFRFYLQQALNYFGWEIEEFDYEIYTPDIRFTPVNNLIIQACEVQDLFKKTWVYGKELDEEKMRKQLGMLVRAYLALLSSYSMTDKLITDANMYKLVTGPDARYPLGYSDAAAIARADKAAEAN